ncbi:MAG TPA: hypothetical protein VJK52_01245 [Candidatus Nanoarchaeia archaeon]|nr:hypothetical protein [Candidatus Nanoarchaeia archaeon]
MLNYPELLAIDAEFGQEGSAQEAILEAMQQVQALGKVNRATRVILDDIAAIIPSPEERITREFYILHYKLLKAAGFIDASQTFSLSCWEFSRLTDLPDASVRRKVRAYYKVQTLPATRYPVRVLEAACADLLEELPTAGEDGLLRIKNKKYITLTRWAQENGFTYAAVQRRVAATQLSPVRGKTTLSRTREYFRETEIRRACDDLITTDQANKRGFLIRNGMKYGMAESWADDLGISKTVISAKVKGIRSIEGRDRSGRPTEFYSEQDVRNLFDDYLALPKVEEDGFKILGKGKFKKRYATAKTWSEECEINLNWLRRKLQNVIFVDGISRDGLKAKLYAEDQIRQLCKSFHSDLAKANDEGVVCLKGVTYRTIHGWSIAMKIDEGVLKRKLQDAHSIQAMTTNGHVANFYSKQVIQTRVSTSEWQKRVRGWPVLLRVCETRQDFLRLFRKAKIPPDKWSDYLWLRNNGFSGLELAIRSDSRFGKFSVFIACMEGRLPMNGISSEREAQALLRLEILRLRSSGKWIEPSSKKNITQKEYDEIARQHHYKKNAVVKAVADFLSERRSTNEVSF